jgi:hypothetical protein
VPGGVCARALTCVPERGHLPRPRGSLPVGVRRSAAACGCADVREERKLVCIHARTVQRMTHCWCDECGHAAVCTFAEHDTHALAHNTLTQ